MNTEPGTAEVQSNDAAEIIVVGDGPVGLMAAIALADIGRETLLIAPTWDAPVPEDDARTTAIMGPGITFLEDLGAWPEIASRCAPLKRLRIVNARSRSPMPGRADATFDAREIGEDAFGWNVPSSALKPALRKAAERRPHLRVIRGDRVQNLAESADGYRLVLEGGEVLSAGLIVAADGRNSQLRTAAGIATRDSDLGQSAIVCSFDHAHDHEGTSIELHHDAGPFTMVPLPGCRSSLVWVMSHDEAKERMAMRPERFFARLDHLVRPWLGPIDRLSVPSMWPLREVLADSLARANLILAGETAHAFSPIGAQGLNLSIRDITTLRQLVEDLEPPRKMPLSTNLGSEVALKYARRRTLDIQSRVRGVGLLNGIVKDRSTLAGLAHELGLQAVGRVPILRRMAMQILMPPRFFAITKP